MPLAAFSLLFGRPSLCAYKSPGRFWFPHPPPAGVLLMYVTGRVHKTAEPGSFVAGLTAEMAAPSASIGVSRPRASACRRRALILAKASSMGLLVRRVRWQIQKLAAPLFDKLPDHLPFVSTEVVHHHNLTFSWVSHQVRYRS